LEKITIQDMLMVKKDAKVVEYLCIGILAIIVPVVDVNLEQGPDRKN
jgi:hypothetical protein